MVRSCVATVTPDVHILSLCVLQTKDAPGSEEEEEEEERPSMDLFKAVFASSSDEKSSSSSEEEEEEEDEEEDKDEGVRLAGAASLFNITPSVKNTTTPSSTAAGPPGNDSLSKGRSSVLTEPPVTSVML